MMWAEELLKAGRKVEATAATLCDLSHGSGFFFAAEEDYTESIKSGSKALARGDWTSKSPVRLPGPEFHSL